MSRQSKELIIAIVLILVATAAAWFFGCMAWLTRAVFLGCAIGYWLSRCTAGLASASAKHPLINLRFVVGGSACIGILTLAYVIHALGAVFPEEGSTVSAQIAASYLRGVRDQLAFLSLLCMTQVFVVLVVVQYVRKAYPSSDSTLSQLDVA